MPAEPGWFERWQRLSGMGWDELRVRSSQEAAKRWDLVLSHLGIPFIQDALNPGPQSSGRFFFRQEDIPGILDCLHERLPDVVGKTIAQAEQICHHRFDLLGYEGVEYGPEIDWHFDAVHGKRAPCRPWFKVPYLDFHEVGDSKVIWELNRHQHLVTLAKAYRLAGEARYARELFRQWYQWQEQNPYPIGINWASSLEVAFRSISWLWIRHLLQGSPVVPEQFTRDLGKALMLSARHIERFLSTYFSPNTHLLGEGVGLFFIGILCPGCPSSQRWQKRGWQIIEHEAQRQVRADGMHFEQSIYYHTYAVDFLLHACILAGLNGIPVSANFRHTLENMLEVLCSLRKAGPIPGLGDDDGGRVFDPTRNRREHLFDPLSTGAVLFHREDFKTVAGGLREETIWLLGAADAQRFDKIPLTKSATAASLALEASGIYLMSATRPGTHQLVIDAGPQGAGKAGHGHADALSVQLAVNGQALLIDPGTYVYVDGGDERDRFRGTRYHNTVQVDDLHQTDPAGAFGWKDLPHTNVSRWISTKTFDFFTGTHDGYCRLTDPVQHRRSIFYLKPCFWIIRDVLSGVGEHRSSVSWCFAPGSVSVVPGGVTYQGSDHAPLSLLFTASQECSREISQGWYSPVYGKKVPSPVVRFSAQARLPVEFVTLLFPPHQASAHLGLLQPFETGDQGAGVRAYRCSIASSTDYFFFADEAGDWQVGPWSSDARFLYCSTSSGKNLNQVVICDGSYLEVAEQRVLTADKRQIRDAWLFNTQVAGLN